jgi:hypothetical protein
VHNSLTEATAYLKPCRNSATSGRNVVTFLEHNEGGHRTDSTFVHYFFLCVGINLGEYDTLVVWLLGQLLEDRRDDLVTKCVNMAPSSSRNSEGRNEREG